MSATTRTARRKMTSAVRGRAATTPLALRDGGNFFGGVSFERARAGEAEARVVVGMMEGSGDSSVKTVTFLVRVRTNVDRDLPPRPQRSLDRFALTYITLFVYLVFQPCTSVLATRTPSSANKHTALSLASSS